MIRHTVLLLALVALCVGPVACGRASTGTSYVDPSIETFAQVGWLGAHVQPLTRDLTIPLDDEEHVPGGVVVRTLDEEAPLARAGARVGDVLVRVDENWMPLKRHMHLDFVRLVEQAVSAGRTSVELGIWRGGALITVSLAAQRTPIETGLPVNVARFDEGAAQALAQLAPGDASPATWALTGLAVLASGTPDADLLAQAKANVRAGLDAGDATSGDLAWGLLFEAEQVGALPTAYVLAASDSGGAASSKGPVPPAMPGAAGGMPVQVTPDQLKELMEKLKAGGATVTMGGGPPPGVGSPAGDAPKPTPGKKTPRKTPPKRLPKARDLLKHLDPARIPKLERLGKRAAGLIERQAEGGGWSQARDGEPDAETTSLALWALGAVLRAGGSVSAEPIEKGLGYLRETLHEGRLSIEVAKGADRRIEAGRAALGAMALRALGCPDSDEMLLALLKFSDGYGAEVLDAERQQTAYLIATGVGRRGRGLATWDAFYNDFRFRLVAAQTPSGAFVPLEAEGGTFGDTASATAAGALLLALQSERVPLLLAKAENPLAPRWDSAGKLVSGKTAAAAPAGAAQPPAEVMELLKGLGVKKLPGGGK